MNTGQSVILGDDNGITRDSEGLVTGVQNPFRFTVSNQAPNDHIIPIKVIISAGNGFDSEDQATPYKFEGGFDLIVQREGSFLLSRRIW